MPGINSAQLAGAVSGASSQQSVSDVTTPRTSVRNSIDLKNLNLFENGTSVADTSTSIVSPSGNHILATPPKLQQSFSTGDVPTVKSSTNGGGFGSNTNNHAQQHFHHHNASIGRIPAGAMHTRHSRELSTDANLGGGRDNHGFPNISSTLHAQAVPFGPVSQAPTAPSNPAVTSPPYAPYFNGPPFNAAPYSAPNGGGANGYPANLMMGMQALSLNGANGNGYSPQNYPGYNPLAYNANRQPQDSQARVIQSRRQLDGEGMFSLYN